MVNSYSFVVKKFDTKTELNTVINNVYKIFSVIPKLQSTKICNIDKNKWRVVFCVNEEDKYNTFTNVEIGNFIIHCMIQNRFSEEFIIGFKQPELDLLVELYDLFIRKIVRHIRETIKYDEDDLYQICMMALVKLYNKGYYISHSLLKSTCINEVLIYFRNERKSVKTESLDKFLHSENDKDLKFINMIVDEKWNIYKDINEHLEYINNVFEDVKNIFINRYGERQFNILFNAYSNKCTTNNNAVCMYRFKKYLTKQNINIHTFDKYL